MSRPTVRVLALLELLQARGSASGAELAQALEVDRRTLRRYIATLEELGIPIMASQGRFGGYQVRRAQPRPRPGDARGRQHQGQAGAGHA